MRSRYCVCRIDCLSALRASEQLGSCGELARDLDACRVAALTSQLQLDPIVARLIEASGGESDEALLGFPLHHAAE